MFHNTNTIARVVGMVFRELWAKVINSMKQQCVLAASSFITKLEKCFPMQELLNVTKVIYS
jgi:hypothetical protein